MPTSDAVRLGVAQYDLMVRKLTYLGQSEHETWRVDTETGERFLLRRHINDLSVKELESELVWLEFLTSRGLETPLGVKNRSGEYITKLLFGEETLIITLLKWVKGRFVHQDLKPEQLRRVGELMARLHNVSSTFEPPHDFIRPVWGAESLEQDMEHISRHYFGFMPAEHLDIFREAVHKITPYIRSLPKSKDAYGLIHADLHAGNIVYLKGQPRPIDFGRCGFGFYLYDIAQTFIDLYPQDRIIFMEGYRSQQELPANSQEIIECFFIMACIENVGFHCSNPKERGALQRKTPYLMILINGYLKGTSFLFG